MGPEQLGTWNKVSKPVRSANHIAVVTGERSRPTAKYIPSKETPQRPEETGGHRSEQVNSRIGRRNVAKSGLISPPAEPMPKGLMDGGKY